MRVAVVLIGSVLGVGLGLILPLNAGDTLSFFKGFSDLAIRMASFLVFPLLFLQVLLNSYALGPVVTRQFPLKLAAQVALVGLAAATLAALLVTVFLPERLQVGTAESAGVVRVAAEQVWRTLVPTSLTEIWSGPLVYLPAGFLVAILIGRIMYEQRSLVRPVLDFSESLFRIADRLNLYLTTVVSFALIFPVLFRTLAMRSTADLGKFTSTLILILVPAILIIFVLLPAWLLATKRLKRLGTWFQFILLPGIFGAASADGVAAYSPLYFAAGQQRLTRSGQQMHLAVIGLFCRPGTIFVLSICFLQVLRAYTSLDLRFDSIVVAVFGALIVTLLLPAFPGQNLTVCLSVLTLVYGHGIEEGYLIVQPIVPIIGAVAVALDVAVQSFLMLWSQFPAVGDGDKREVRNSRLLGDFQI